jgi:hypothetical protein
MATGDPSSSGGMWHVYTCDGQRFGPITKQELDAWAEEKRLTTSCQVYQDGWPAWRMASEFYRDLPPAAGAASVSAAPNVGVQPGAMASQKTPSQNPYAAPMYAGAAPLSGAAAYQVPHRGTLILVLGILGWAVCCVFALPAWIMGHTDLKRMRAGEMDNSGYSLTMAGMVLAIIQCILAAAVPVIWLIILGIVLLSQQ